MGLAVLLDLHDGAHQSLDHGFVIDEAAVHPRVLGAILSALVVAGLVRVVHPAVHVPVQIIFIAFFQY